MNLEKIKSYLKLYWWIILIPHFYLGIQNNWYSFKETIVKEKLNSKGFNLKITEDIYKIDSVIIKKQELTELEKREIKDINVVTIPSKINSFKYKKVK